MPAGVILYGPPGAGKDTVTAQLSHHRPEYALFERLKAGPGRTAGYRLTSIDHIEEMDRAGEILYRNTRYQAEYAIDRGGLSALVDAGRTPVLHMGQMTGARAVAAYPLHWVKVLLWCPVETTLARCRDRGDKDVDTRLQVWHETQQDLLDYPDDPWSVVIETHRLSPDQAAGVIDKAVAGKTEETARDIRRLVT